MTELDRLRNEFTNYALAWCCAAELNSCTVPGARRAMRKAYSRYIRARALADRAQAEAA